MLRNGLSGLAGLPPLNNLVVMADAAGDVTRHRHQAAGSKSFEGENGKFHGS
jgi:hypothetical protein